MSAKSVSASVLLIPPDSPLFKNVFASTLEPLLSATTMLTRSAPYRYLMNYQETINEIQTTFGSVPGFFDGVPQDVLVQMWPIMKMYMMGQSKISPKNRELISLAVAATLKCPYCETFHRGAAQMHGATNEERAELGAIVGQVTFWSSVLHTMNYDMATFMKEFQAIGEHFAKKQAAMPRTT